MLVVLEIESFLLPLLSRSNENSFAECFSAEPMVRSIFVVADTIRLSSNRNLHPTPIFDRVAERSWFLRPRGSMRVPPEALEPTNGDF